MGKPPDYYKVLGITAIASEAEVRRAYRKLARALHPEAQVRLAELRAAVEVLRDQSRRIAYNLAAHAGQEYEYQTAHPGVRKVTYQPRTAKSRPYMMRDRAYSRWVYRKTDPRSTLGEKIVRVAFCVFVAWVVQGLLYIIFFVAGYGLFPASDDFLFVIQLLGSCLLSILFGIGLYRLLDRRGKLRGLGD